MSDVFKNAHSWEVRHCFDVWGNKDDGWEVNDSTVVGIYILPDAVVDDDNALLEYLAKFRFFSVFDISKLKVNGDNDVIEIYVEETGMPVFWLTHIHKEPRFHVVK